MKGPFKNKQGSTLLEIIVAIAILGLMVAPVCASLVLSFRLNAESEKILQARLLVESTVEQLMAEGLQFEYEEHGDDKTYALINVLPEGVGVSSDSEDFAATVTVNTDGLKNSSPWCKVVVLSGEVLVETNIRVASVMPAQEGGDGE